ncbi:putative sugar O-methyltransferase [Candidatus Pelagibacter sp.]|nr:putative sugar O-methyltransferase [Candidatus Pelagibacter sp.]
MNKEKIHENFLFNIKNYDKIYKSQHWEYQNKKKVDLFKIDNLINFRNNNLSMGLDDQFYSDVETKNLFYSLISELSEKFVYEMLEDKNIGNVKKFFIFKDKYYSANDLFHIMYSKLLNDYFKFEEKTLICEIGPGYGSFINKLYKKNNFKTILIDLPEANYINSYFLNSLYPNKNIFFSCDIKNEMIPPNIFEKYDILILCPWDPLPKIKVDVFINTRSMMEMDYSTISKYFKYIKDNIKDNGIFFCSNRYYKDTVGYPVEFYKYPFDENWKTLYSEKSWKQEHIHCLILQRSKEKRNDIKIEKKKLYELGKIQMKKDTRLIRRITPNFLYFIYKNLKFHLTKIFNAK